MFNVLGPELGLMVVHLGVKQLAPLSVDELKTGSDRFLAAGGQIVFVASVGNQSEAIFMLLTKDVVSLKIFQTALIKSGFEITFSYVSSTEISEYAKGMPQQMKDVRLYPILPPDGFTSWCFYPMSKRRTSAYNWYLLDYEVRELLMRSHGAVGRKFAGKVVQVVTGSTGLDNWEWGVTLFAKSPTDLKEVVYTMRYDEASAKYGEFGDFIFGYIVESLQDLIEINRWDENTFY